MYSPSKTAIPPVSNTNEKLVSAVIMPRFISSRLIAATTVKYTKTHASTRQTYFFCGFRRRAAIIKSGSATANVWFSHEFNIVPPYQGKPAHDADGDKKVVTAAAIENIHAYCRAS